MPLHMSAARLWLLSTLSCPASCMWPPVVSDAVHCSPLWSCRSIFSFVFPSFWFHVHIRCMLFWGIVRSLSDSDVQSIVAVCSVFCLLSQFWYLVCWIFLCFLSCLFSWLPLSSVGMAFQILEVPVSASLSLSMSQRYTVGCSTLVAYLIHACFCGLDQFLGVPHLPQRLPSSPHQTNSPFHILVRPLLCADISSQIHKVLRLLQFLPFHLQAKLLVSFSQKLLRCSEYFRSLNFTRSITPLKIQLLFFYHKSTLIRRNMWVNIQIGSLILIASPVWRSCSREV